MSTGSNTFLTKPEKDKIQTLFTQWKRETDPDEIAEKLFTRGRMSVTDKEKFSSKPTRSERAEFLYDEYLCRGTYGQLCEVRQILISLQQNTAHLTIAKALPTRGEAVDYSWVDDTTSYPFPETNNLGSKEPSDETAPPNLRILTLKRGRLDVTTDRCWYQKGPLVDSAGPTRGSKSSPWARPTKTSPNHAGSIDLTCYGFKTFPMVGVFNRADHLPRIQCGKGLCAIIRNFTDDLTGYNCDSQRIKTFFAQQLHFDVLEQRDVSKAKLMEFLQDVKNELSNKAAYDRFTLFILSHGDEAGIKCCVQNTDPNEPAKQYKEEMTADNGDVRVPVEDVIQMFVHVQGQSPAPVASMKNFPKCFFFQICQGEQAAQGAADGEEPGSDAKFLPIPEIKICEGADALVCYASVKGTKSWVESDGSVFIKHTMNVFNDFFRTEHVADMMVEVNKRVSRAVLKGQHTSRIDRVYQMPEAINRLTRKFFLVIPEKYIGKHVHYQEQIKQGKKHTAYYWHEPTE